MITESYWVKDAWLFDDVGHCNWVVMKDVQLKEGGYRLVYITEDELIIYDTDRETLYNNDDLDLANVYVNSWGIDEIYKSELAKYFDEATIVDIMATLDEFETKIDSMGEKRYRFESRGLIIEGWKEQILALYNIIHYDDTQPSYLSDLFTDIEVAFPKEIQL